MLWAEQMSYRDQCINQGLLSGCQWIDRSALALLRDGWSSYPFSFGYNLKGTCMFGTTKRLTCSYPFSFRESLNGNSRIHATCMFTVARLGPPSYRERHNPLTFLSKETSFLTNMPFPDISRRCGNEVSGIDRIVVGEKLAGYSWGGGGLVTPGSSAAC